jgi:chromate transporter
MALLRRLCVEERAWLSEAEFEDGIAAVNLLPGPAAAQLAIFCAWRLRGLSGGVVGGLCLIVPGLMLILALAILFLQSNPPLWIEGAAAGSGAAVSAVAVQAARSLLPASWRRAGLAPGARIRWCMYLGAGGVAAATLGPWLVLVLMCCGLVEVLVRAGGGLDRSMAVLAGVAAPSLGGLAALSWVSFKVGALAYGGGFVIVPLMQHDAVDTYHWMTAAQFLNAVALGQVTPGPVLQTVAVVGYAAAGVGGALLAATVAFAPSFVFVFVGGPRFDRLRDKLLVRAFLNGAGPAAIGGIAGASIPLALALGHPWQVIVLAGAACWLLLFRRGVVSTVVGAGVVGILAALWGAPVGM